mgnify:CR=1 FL=1
MAICAECVLYVAVTKSVAYSYHNHLDTEVNYTFSEDDVAGFIANKEAYMKASDSKYTYEIRRRKDTVDKSWNEVYHRHKSCHQERF